MRKAPPALVLVLALVACGQAAETTTTAASTTTSEATTTTEAIPEGLVTTVEDLPLATIQIVSTGTFVTPDFGEFEGGGSGSGFIIDPSGVAVTNSHVVSGAGLIEVYVGGDPDPINAQILGVSECNDLAVIDLAEDGYHYLEWYEGTVTAGTDVYAAGYPLGDPQFTITQGIISKSDFPGETEWASVDAILEHDARIRPGNSGGPLVNADMQVVGVNYAGRDDTDQNFAISVTDAAPIVDELRAGSDVDSVGINGYAILADDGTTGIWVETVQPGSPADASGVTGGDIVTRMAGVSLGLDGTLADFCDVIRTQGTTGVIPVEVLRYDTAQVLRGQLNGTALAEVFSFAEELEDDATVQETGDVYTDYTVISDDTGAMQVEVPVEWSDVDGAPYTDNEGRQITDVRAAADLAEFQESWTTPGMIFSASSDWLASTSEEALLDLYLESLGSQCTYAGREVYEDPAYTGWYDTYIDCGDTLATYVVVAARPPEGAFILLVQVQANEERDFEALDHILSSFYVSGGV
ncbi:MAG TPA: S1C family serine protease [Acidimicrobiia bacterium]|nr:S1C family serine protease [Acidimicrobiia bacterium]